MDRNIESSPFPKQIVESLQILKEELEVEEKVANTAEDEKIVDEICQQMRTDCEDYLTRDGKTIGQMVMAGKPIKLESPTAVHPLGMKLDGFINVRFYRERMFSRIDITIEPQLQRRISLYKNLFEEEHIFGMIHLNRDDFGRRPTLKEANFWKIIVGMVTS